MAHSIACTPRNAPRSGGIFARIKQASAIYKQRRQLAGLDDSRLFDLGLTRDEALNEARRLPWDLHPRLAD